MACAQAAQAAFRSFLDVGIDQLEFRHAPHDRAAVATVAALARLRECTVGRARRADFLFDLCAQQLQALHTHQLAQLRQRSEEHTSELQSLMRTSYAVLCLQKNNNI